MLPFSTEIEVFPAADYESVPVGNGRHRELFSDPLVAPLEANRFFLGCDRLWDEAADDGEQFAIKCRAEISYDGGKTWALLVAFCAPSVHGIGPDGYPPKQSWMTHPIGHGMTESDNPQRLVRVSFVPIQTIRTRVWGAFTKAS